MESEDERKALNSMGRGQGSLEQEMEATTNQPDDSGSGSDSSSDMPSDYSPSDDELLRDSTLNDALCYAQTKYLRQGTKPRPSESRGKFGFSSKQDDEVVVEDVICSPIRLGSLGHGFRRPELTEAQKNDYPSSSRIRRPAEFRRQPARLPNLEPNGLKFLVLCKPQEPNGRAVGGGIVEEGRPHLPPGEEENTVDFVVRGWMEHCEKFNIIRPQIPGMARGQPIQKTDE